MTTSDGAGTVGSIAASNGAVISQTVVNSTDTGLTYGGNPTTRSYVTLPASVTSIVTVAMIYNGTATGTTNDDVAYNFDSLYSCPATLNIAKTSLGDVGTFSFSSLTNATPTTDSVTTASINTPVTSATLHTIMSPPGSTTVTVTEAATPGYTLTAASCNDQNGANNANGVTTFGTVAGSVLTIPAANIKGNSHFLCTVTNTKTPTVTLMKLVSGGSGTNTFNFTLTGLNHATDTAASVPVGSATTGSNGSNTATIGTAVSLTESSATSPALSSYSTAVSCVDSNSAVTGNSTPLTSATTTVTIPAAKIVAGAAYTCTYTNTRKFPLLSLTKTSNGPWVAGQSAATYTLTPSNSAGTLATSGTLTVIDTLPSGITPGWTGTAPGNGNWACTFSGQTVTCTNSSDTIAAGANGANIVLPVNVSGTAGTVTNYASIGGGGDLRNSGVAPTPGAGCTPSGLCASVATTFTAAPALTCSTNLYGIFGDTTTTTNVQSLSLTNTLGPVITTIPTSTSNAAMAISTGGDKIFVMGSDYILRVYDVPTNTWTTAGALTGYIAGDGRPLRMAIGPDGTGYLGMSNSFWTFSQTAPYTLSSVKTVTYTDTSGLTPTPFFMRTTGNDNTSGDFFVDADNNLYLMANPALASGGVQAYLDLFVIQGLNGASPTATFAGRFPTPTSTPNPTYAGIAALSSGIYAIGFGGELLSINLTSKTVTALPTNSSNIGTDLGTCSYPSLRPSITSTKTVAKTAGSAGSTVVAGDTLTYTIIVRNAGTLVATGVSLQDSIPAGTTYVTGSTTLNTGAVTDATGGVMPYVAGKAIKSPGSSVAAGQLSVDSTPVVTTDNEATITFKVKVNAGTTSTSNTGVLQYTDNSTGTPTTTTVNTPTATTSSLLDYGEAPTAAPGTLSANSYKTLLAEDGARHSIVTGIHLGATEVADTDGTPVPFGADITATDNDGVTFNPAGGVPKLLKMSFSGATTNTVVVNASTAGYLNAWVDFNQNGLFETTDRIFADVPVVAGNNTLTFNVPTTTIPGLTYTRFRFTTAPGVATSPSGLAPDGEVEDYAVKINNILSTSVCSASPLASAGLNLRWYDPLSSSTTSRLYQRVGTLSDGTLIDVQFLSRGQFGAG
ncbi:beta strand repeat-containing protein [Deinococcus ruber]|nr:GEVED domain-containing protein [Deinococcus ruber]